MTPFFYSSLTLASLSCLPRPSSFNIPVSSYFFDEHCRASFVKSQVLTNKNFYILEMSLLLSLRNTSSSISYALLSFQLLRSRLLFERMLVIGFKLIECHEYALLCFSINFFGAIKFTFNINVFFGYNFLCGN